MPENVAGVLREDRGPAGRAGVEGAPPRPRPASESFDVDRFRAALAGMDAIADESDTEEVWEAITEGIRSARNHPGNGA